MGLIPSPSGLDGHAHLQVRPVSWLVLACAAFWLALGSVTLTVLLHL